MRLKKVAAECKKGKRAWILKENGYTKDGGKYLARQYISDGSGFWNATGLPSLDKEGLLRIFDVNERDFDKWWISIEKFPGGMNFQDYDPEEREIEEGFWPVIRGGQTLYIFATAGNGVMFIPEEQILAASDSNYRRYTQRRGKDGSDYLAVKNGTMLEAVILPARLGDLDQVARSFKELAFRVAAQRMSAAGKIQLPTEPGAQQEDQAEQIGMGEIL